MGVIASQITSVSIVYSAVCSGTDQRKHQNAASLAFVGGIHRGPARNAENVSIWWRHHVIFCTATGGQLDEVRAAVFISDNIGLNSSDDFTPYSWQYEMLGLLWCMGPMNAIT